MGLFEKELSALEDTMVSATTVADFDKALQHPAFVLIEQKGDLHERKRAGIIAGDMLMYREAAREEAAPEGAASGDRTDG